MFMLMHSEQLLCAMLRLKLHKSCVVVGECYVVSCCIMLCCVMLCHVVLCYVVSCCVVFFLINRGCDAELM